jgi:hypothetical protein
MRKVALYVKVSRNRAPKFEDVGVAHPALDRFEYYPP